MRATQLLLASCLFFTPLVMTTAIAQQDDNPTKEQDFSLRRIEPQNVYADELYRTIDTMYGRELEFEDRTVMNLALLEESIVIYETPERMQRILDAVAQLDIDLREQHGGDEEEDVAIIDPFSVVLESYMPKYLASTELYTIASELYGREIFVNDDWHDTLRLTNRGLLVYDLKGPAMDMLARLKDLDESQAPNADVQLVTTQYRPRHLSACSLMQGLESFRTPIRVSAMMGSSATNISVLDERGILVIRDDKARVAEILTTLEALDQPAPQVMVVCQILHGVRGAATNPADEDLQKQLRQLLPYESYQVASSGMLRGSAVTGNPMEIKLSTKDGGEYNLKMHVGAYDPETGALDLSRCELSLLTQQNGNQQLFNTSATIYKDEYAVLGVTGAEPLFLVVQLHPVQSTR